eukprot:125732_1
MAQEGLVETHTDETSNWLQSNGLSNIIEKCLENDITFEVLIEASADDIKMMCADAGIKTQHRLKLISALKKVPNSTIAQSSKPKVVYLSTQEKELMSKFDATFDTICKDLKQNKQTIKEFEKQKTSIISEINSKMDSIIKSFEEQRQNMIDTVNKISTEKSITLQHQNTKKDELKQLFTDKKCEIDKICIESTSDKATKIKFIVNNSINKYNKFKNNDKNICHTMNIVMNTDKIVQTMKQNCYVEEPTYEYKEAQLQVANEYFAKCGSYISITNNNKTISNLSTKWDTVYGAVEIDCNDTQTPRIYQWKFKIDNCKCISIGIDESKQKWINHYFKGQSGTINYALGQDGAVHKTKSSKVESSDNRKFGAGDTITMKLDIKSKTLAYYKNDDQNFIVQISKIKTVDVKYNMAIYCWMNGSVRLIGYSSK